MKIDCYSDFDRGFLGKINNIKHAFFLPCLKFFEQLKFQPIHLTLISLALGLLGCFLFIPEYFILAQFLIFLHLIFDGLDGSYARYKNQMTNSGSFVDSMVDNIVLSAFMMVAYHKGYCGFFEFIVVTLFYNYVVIFAFCRNFMQIAYKFVIRPRLFIYSAFLIDFIFKTSLFMPILYLSAIILFWHFLESMLAIYKKFNELQNEK
jgi:phosphatidylglycerophosphate synthase